MNISFRNCCKVESGMASMRRTSLQIFQITLLAIFTLVPLASAWDYKSCGEGQLKVSKVDLQPEHITPGTDSKFLISVVPSTDISEGTIQMLVKLAGIPVYAEQDDLCSKTTCPLAAGEEGTIAFVQSFPIYTPTVRQDVMSSST